MSDLILRGGTILTLDDRQPRASALAVRDGQVAAVGDDEVLTLRRDATEVVDLAGRIVCPGFIDAHHHLTLAAWCQLGIDLAGCHSVTEVRTRIPARAAQARTGDWLYAYNYTPRRFDHGPGLTRYDLDEVIGDRPALVLHFSYHEGVVSSAGLRAAGITRHTPDPQGGRIVRFSSGEPTGELLETAISPVEALARTAAAGTGYEDWLAALERYCQGLFAAGITHVCDPGIDPMLEGYLRRAQSEGRLPLPVTMLFTSGAGLFQPPLDRLSGPRTGERMDDLAVGALKLFADGGSRCAVCVGLLESLAGVVALSARAVRLHRPALLREASAPDHPHLGHDGRLRTGYLHYRSEALAAMCRQAQAHDFQLAVHAACNAAIEEVIDIYGRLPAGRYPHRIEHLVSLDAHQAQRLAATGAIGVVQPAYIAQMGAEWEAMPAPPRLQSMPLRMLLDAGVPLAGSSDAPVAPYSPLAGMQAAITRRTDRGWLHQPHQAILPLEALRLWTTGAALAANRLGELGVLRPGARGDLLILSQNPLETPIAQLSQIRVERTVIGGKTVYAADDTAHGRRWHAYD